MPVAEIARRAGVGTGTVGRHFPTKDSVYAAIVPHLTEEILERARHLTTTFFELFAHVVEQAAANRGLAGALGGNGFDLEACGAPSLVTAQETMLAAAQQAGSVRPDLTRADVKALLIGCIARERDAPAREARHRMTAVARAGMQAERQSTGGT